MTDSSDTLVLYSKPNCVQCTATTKWLDARGVSYQYFDISTDSVAHSKALSLGYMQAPVAVAGDTHWSGFNISKLEAYVAQL